MGKFKLPKSHQIYPSQSRLEYCRRRGIATLVPLVIGGTEVVEVEGSVPKLLRTL